MRQGTDQGRLAPLLGGSASKTRGHRGTGANHLSAAAVGKTRPQLSEPNIILVYKMSQVLCSMSARPHLTDPKLPLADR